MLPPEEDGGGGSPTDTLLPFQNNNINSSQDFLIENGDFENIHHVQVPVGATSSFERLFCRTHRRLSADDASHYEGQGSGSGWFSGSMMIVNAALGAGLLNFPASFHQAGGVLVACLVQFALMIFIIPALIILAYTSDFNGSKTLQEVLNFAWGKIGQRFTSLIIAIYCFGTCITFIIIIGDQFDRVFASVYGPEFCHTFYMNRAFTMVATSFLFILPFCYPKKIDFLKHISSLGVLAVVYCSILIVYQYYAGDFVPGEIKTRPDKWTDVFLVVPTICFGYQCHVSVIPIYSCYKERRLRNFSASTALAITICILTYTVSATFGYLTFGSKISSDILSSYTNAQDASILIAIIAIAIKSYTTYPLLLFCGREAVSNLWLDASLAFGTLYDTPRDERFRRITIATIWFLLTIILSVLLPNIGSVIKLLGSLAAIFIFVFPGLCLLKIGFLMEDYSYSSFDDQRDFDRSSFKRKTRGFLTFLAGLFLFIGAFLFGCVLSQAILYDFIEEEAAEIPLCTWSKSSELNAFMDSVHLYHKRTI